MGVLIWVLGVVLALGAAVGSTEASETRYYDFLIKETANYTRLCQQKTVLTVNGQSPGPTISARKGDVVVVNVHNQGNKNITIHWHGVDQPRNPWSDGPNYITQCPIQPGANLTYTIILSEEEGTLWWHAHSDYDRNTVHGAIIILPELGTDFPFKKPDYEIVPIILGEWWIADLNELLEESRRTGGAVPISNATTINGQPGDLFPCSQNGTFKAAVQSGKTYLLRIINAGLANDLFFAVAGHRLTVVGTDAHYTKNFTTDQIFISPGQTVDALLEANRTVNGSSNGRYYMAARTLATLDNIEFDNTTGTAILEYTDAPPATRAGTPDFPNNLPATNDLNTSKAYTAQLRSLGGTAHPVHVPMDNEVDTHMIITIAVNAFPCTTVNGTCMGPLNQRFGASLNNITFHLPSIDILDAYSASIGGVFETDFPDMPPFPSFNFTDDNIGPEQWFSNRGTKVKVLKYGAVVEVVFQNTGILGSENHPMHLHGYSFYVIGRGLGNFNKTTDPGTYKLIDPPFQNTVTVPKGGWAAIRFRATNPGVWFMHCHFERHSEWGMDTVFVVKDGKAPKEKMMRRPPGMPKC